ncbi:hypothetical protein BGZ65_003306 [Modicella reniformis]|uniref:BCD1 alpha/beta domain-containing protein n=1 Tax=Modicella reniformis TaxID=1440133 RepID=A0A9P6SM69_9FUNG|nr:hypothetical protein BGZ65_003306 [Modicella reniformis]
MQARKRGTQLIRMVAGLKKRKENNTHLRDKPSRILWTIEWLLSELDTPRRILEHKNDESQTLKNLFAKMLSKEGNKDLTEDYPQDVWDQCRFFFVIPLRHANQPALYPLRNTDSLLETLKLKKVLEFPTILVIKPSSPSKSTSDESSLPIDQTSTTAVTEAPSQSASSTTGDNLSMIKSSTLLGDTTDSQITVAQEPTHPVLKKYTLELPPSQWPTRATREPRQDGNGNKRSNDVSEDSEAAAKKLRLSEGEEEGDEEEKEREEGGSSVEDSSEDSTSDSDASDDSEDDDDDDDSSSSSDDDNSDANGSDSNQEEGKNDGNDSKVSVNKAQGDTQISDQSILEAFNQDFGHSE